MTKLIKEKIHTIINTISPKKETIQHLITSNKNRIERSKRGGSDEYGYVSRMENL